MSVRENDIERGFETPSGLRMNSPLQTLQTPVGMQPVRNSTYMMSPSVMAQQENAILQAFRFHVGIHNDSSLAAKQRPATDKPTSKSFGGLISAGVSSFTSSNTVVPGMDRPAANIGIYHRVINAERRYLREYKIFSFLINSALGLQIIFAAALTALGAGNGPHSAVTAFGALNTVLAGFLTFLKGSGLPSRLKYYANEWCKVREYIEQRERDFGSEFHRHRLGWEELAEEIGVIESMYETTRKDIEANTPDSYVSMSNAVRSISSNNNTAGGQIPGLARNLTRITNKTHEIEDEARRMGQTLNSRVGTISGSDHRFNKSHNDLEKQAMYSISEVANSGENRIRDTGKHAEYAVESGLNRSYSAADSRFHDTQNSVQNRFHDTQNLVQSRLADVQTSALNRLNDIQTSAQTRANEIQHSMQSRVDDAQHRVTDAQTATQSRIGEVQHGIEENVHQVESKAKEMEEKVAMAAEKAAERVLQFTQHRHS